MNCIWRVLIKSVRWPHLMEESRFLYVEGIAWSEVWGLYSYSLELILWVSLYGSRKISFLWGKLCLPFQMAWIPITCCPLCPPSTMQTFSGNPFRAVAKTFFGWWIRREVTLGSLSNAIVPAAKSVYCTNMYFIDIVNRRSLFSVSVLGHADDP